MARSFHSAQPHGAIRELFDDVFFVSGGIRMSPPPMSFSRNMTIVRDGEALTLINTMRLSDAGLAELDALGKVAHVIRLAGFHGRDDPFYKDHYGAKVWVVEGMRYVKGFDIVKPSAPTYFEPDASMTPDSELPIPGAKLFCFESTRVPEGILVLDRNGGIAVTGDSLQNWATADEFFSFGAKMMMKLMGFIKPHNVGPGWIREAKPTAADVRRVLDLPFEHLLPGHGSEVIGNAKESFRPAIERMK
jgi:hypothetical protein